MSKQNPKQKNASGKGASRRRNKRDESAEEQGSAFAAVRETIESIVIAFVLAFLFRTFEAEAFVIPTGSMAPTLLGANKDVECEQCGYAYQASASSEDPNAKDLPHDPQQRAEVLRGRAIVATTCPVCNYTMTVARHSGESAVEEQPTYSGDRILVDKISYQIGEPKRWDIFVFKFPNESATNYIKRLVGLPNETLRIYRGDILVKKPGEPDTSFQPARRSDVPKKLHAMLHTVHDNHHIPRTLVEAKWPRRWAPVKSADGRWVPLSANADPIAGDWTLPSIEFDESGVGQQAFEIDGTTEPLRWLRYRHLVPSFNDWETMLATGAPPAGARTNPKHWLITDHYAYNNKTQRGAAESQNSVEPPSQIGMNWVGDLGVECEVELLSGSGELVLELVEGGKQFQCRINLQDGRATMSIVGINNALATAQTDVHGQGTYRLLFANLDNELLLWIDDSLVRFDTSTTYPLSDDPQGVDTSVPNLLDQAPAGIAAAGAHLRVSRLKVFRDIYYIAMRD
jgi:signal peptidase I